MVEEMGSQSLDARDACGVPDNTNKIKSYLIEHSPEFQKLAALRKQGWSRPEGDQHFQSQRKKADQATQRTKAHFFQMMKRIALDMQTRTGALKLPGDAKVSILDTCMAPGGFLSVIMDLNPSATAAAFTLPSSSGGHEVLLRLDPSVNTHFVDITMLAEDLGVTDIPADHPDAGNFLPRQLPPEQLFDIVICDGQVLRTHQRAEYREPREARRLTATQLALGLRHLQPGGTMIVLLHKVEAPQTIYLIKEFTQFSRVQLYKSTRYHATRSSFYIIATSIMSQSPEAAHSIRQWEATWRTATFGPEEDFINLVRQQGADAEEYLVNFGQTFISMAAGIWLTQADALARAPFMRNQV